MISFPRAYFYSNPAQSLFFFGEGPILKCQVGNALHELDKFIAENQNRYLVTFLGYDLKNEIEDLKSENKDFLQFPDLFCWNPAFVISLEKGKDPIYLQGEKSDFSEKEIENWLNELNLPKKELPKILTTDPIVAYFNLKRGQIIRIIRCSEQSGFSVIYRIVAKGGS